MPTLSKILRSLLSLIPSDTQIRILRGPLSGNRWIVGASPHACWIGTYEVDRLRSFAAAISPGDTVYDIGANVGIYSLLASSRTGPSGIVYAFEPQLRNVDFLRRHLTLNHVQNCTIIESAVCNTEGTLRFSGVCWEPSMGRLSAEGEVEVSSTTLDKCVYGQKGLRPPDILKIDVEGAEFDLLQGASRTLTEFHPKMFLETHGTQLHSDCRGFLVALGYTIAEQDSVIKTTYDLRS